MLSFVQHGTRMLIRIENTIERKIEAKMAKSHKTSAIEHENALYLDSNNFINEINFPKHKNQEEEKEQDVSLADTVA